MRIVVPKIKDDKVACTLVASYGMGGGRRNELAARLDVQERRRNGDKAMQIVINKTKSKVSKALRSENLSGGVSKTIRAEYWKSCARNILFRTDGFRANGVMCIKKIKE